LEVGRGVVDDDLAAAGGDLADAGEADGDAAEGAVEAGPVGRVGLGRGAGAGDEVEAAFGAWAAVFEGAGGAAIAGLEEPDAGEGDMGAFGEAFDDVGEEVGGGADLGDLEETIGEGLVFGLVVGPEMHGEVIALRVGKGDEKSLATRSRAANGQGEVWK
jgi:hypothetical protein